ncbi:hypothetical protein ABFA07_021666 [Porites harrisoni]
MSDSGAKGNTSKESSYPDNNTQDNESNDSSENFLVRGTRAVVRAPVDAYRWGKRSVVNAWNGDCSIQ